MKIGIFGTGAYGLALSSILNNNRCELTMWTKFAEEKELLEKERQNKDLLPGYILDDNIKITNDVKECMNDKDLLIIAIPAAFVSSLCDELAPYIKDNHIIIATKGIEQKTGLFINEIVANKLNTKNIAVISGPTFAIDIVSKMPIGLSIASKSEATISLTKEAFQNSFVKLRETNDIIGVEICGSIKNVIALSAGILEGLKANESTKALLITEALNDMEEILEAFECDRRTVLSYAGIGDLLLTCTSKKSRNFSFGCLLGSKPTEDKIDEYLKTHTVEGYYTLESIYNLLKDKKVSIPIIDLIYEIAVNKQNPELLLGFLIFKR